jgi:hypothetical protein
METPVSNNTDSPSTATTKSSEEHKKLAEECMAQMLEAPDEELYTHAWRMGLLHAILATLPVSPSDSHSDFDELRP